MRDSMLNGNAKYIFKDGSVIEWSFKDNNLSYWRTMWHSNWVKIRESFKDWYSNGYRSARYNNKIALAIETKYSDSDKIKIYDTSSDFINRYNEASEMFNAEINMYIKARTDTMKYITTNQTNKDINNSYKSSSYTNTATQVDNYSPSETNNIKITNNLNTSASVSYRIEKVGDRENNYFFSDWSTLNIYVWESIWTFEFVWSYWLRINQSFYPNWSQKDGKMYFYNDKDQMWNFDKENNILDIGRDYRTEEYSNKFISTISQFRANTNLLKK